MHWALTLSRSGLRNIIFEMLLDLIVVAELDQVLFGVANEDGVILVVVGRLKLGPDALEREPVFFQHRVAR